MRPWPSPRPLLLLLLLACWPAAQAHSAQTRGGESRGTEVKQDQGNPSRPGHAPEAPLGFAETQRVLSAAAAVTRSLSAAPPVLVDTPQGQRLTLPLLWQGRVVARAFLASDGQMVALPRGASLPGESGTARTLSSAALDKVKAQLRTLTLSGAVQATRGEYRVTLLWRGVPVAVLRLDRRTLAPKPEAPLPGRTDPGRSRPPGP